MFDINELPKGFLNECESILGDEYGTFLDSYKKPACRAMRINPLRGYAPAFEKRVPWEPLGRYVPSDYKPSDDIKHFSGAYYMQDASAMTAVAALDPQPGERVLDLCAAPGGKSGQIAARMNGSGFLLSNEIDASRVKILAGNLERMGVRNAYVTSADSSVLSNALPAFFDRVLVDAPCSGEGMFRRDPSAIAQWSRTSVDGCAARQIAILNNAAKTVRGGGRLVYSTCTFNRTENERVICDFLKSNPDFEPLEFALDGVGHSENGCLRLFPHRIEGEGHFVAAMRRLGDAHSDILPPKSDKNAEKALEALKSDILLSVPSGVPCLRNGVLSIIPPEAPSDDIFKGIKLLTTGLVAARLEKARITPLHALAMAIKPEAAMAHVELDYERAKLFVAGETISDDANGRGFALVCFEGLPLGWAKRSDGMLKNHLPKGLRLRSAHAFE